MQKFSLYTLPLLGLFAFASSSSHAATATTPTVSSSYNQSAQANNIVAQSGSNTSNATTGSGNVSSGGNIPMSSLPIGNDNGSTASMSGQSSADND